MLLIFELDIVGLFRNLLRNFQYCNWPSLLSHKEMDECEMKVQLPKTIFVAIAVSALVLSACSSESSESASPVSTTPAAESAEETEIPSDYQIGDTGPGGGIVFFDAGSVQPWGRYLEAGPQLDGAEWCGEDWELDIPGTMTMIGSGAANTTLMADACKTGAATSVREFDGGGMTDWFLPSKDELNELYEQRDTVGGFGIGNDGSSFDAYWSSTQSDEGTTGFADVAWTQYFDGGEQQGNDCKCNLYGVVPVRAF